jgi:hypothetical protein
MSLAEAGADMTRYRFAYLPSPRRDQAAAVDMLCDSVEELRRKLRAWGIPVKIWHDWYFCRRRVKTEP